MGILPVCGLLLWDGCTSSHALAAGVMPPNDQDDVGSRDYSLIGEYTTCKFYAGQGYGKTSRGRRAGGATQGECNVLAVESHSVQTLPCDRRLPRLYWGSPAAETLWGAAVCSRRRRGDLLFPPPEMNAWH